MPGRVKFKRASIVAALLAATVLVTACAGADHTWRGEFDARLEGVSAAIEEKLPELSPGSSEEEVVRAGIELGPKLEFKRELIEKLNPPDGCEAVQEEGAKKVSGTALSVYQLYKNLDPYLHRRLTANLEGVISELEALESEAARCATG